MTPLDDSETASEAASEPDNGLAILDLQSGRDIFETFGVCERQIAKEEGRKRTGMKVSVDEA